MISTALTQKTVELPVQAPAHANAAGSHASDISRQRATESTNVPAGLHEEEGERPRVAASAVTEQAVARPATSTDTLPVIPGRKSDSTILDIPYHRKPRLSPKNARTEEDREARAFAAEYTAAENEALRQLRAERAHGYQFKGPLRGAVSHTLDVTVRGRRSAERKQARDIAAVATFGGLEERADGLVVIPDVDSPRKRGGNFREYVRGLSDRAQYRTAEAQRYVGLKFAAAGLGFTALNTLLAWKGIDLVSQFGPDDHNASGGIHFADNDMPGRELPSSLDVDAQTATTDTTPVAPEAPVDKQSVTQEIEPPTAPDTAPHTAEHPAPQAQGEYTHRLLGEYGPDSGTVSDLVRDDLEHYGFDSSDFTKDQWNALSRDLLAATGNEEYIGRTNEMASDVVVGRPPREVYEAWIQNLKTDD